MITEPEPEAQAAATAYALSHPEVQNDDAIVGALARGYYDGFNAAQAEKERRSPFAQTQVEKELRLVFDTLGPELLTESNLLEDPEGAPYPAEVQMAAYRVVARVMYWTAEQLGWQPFGHHIDAPPEVLLKFSALEDGEGNPMFERTVMPYPDVEAIAKAYFDSEPDGYPGRYEVIGDNIKVRNRQRFEVILKLFEEYERNYDG